MHGARIAMMKFFPFPRKNSFASSHSKSATQLITQSWICDRLGVSMSYRFRGSHIDAGTAALSWKNVVFTESFQKRHNWNACRPDWDIDFAIKLRPWLCVWCKQNGRGTVQRSNLTAACKSPTVERKKEKKLPTFLWLCRPSRKRAVSRSNKLR